MRFLSLSFIFIALFIPYKKDRYNYLSPQPSSGCDGFQSALKHNDSKDKSYTLKHKEGGYLYKGEYNKAITCINESKFTDFTDGIVVKSGIAELALSYGYLQMGELDAASNILCLSLFCLVTVIVFVKRDCVKKNKLLKAQEDVLVLTEALELEKEFSESYFNI